MKQLVRQVTCGVITLGTRGFLACSRMLRPTHVRVKPQEKTSGTEQYAINYFTIPVEL